MSTPKPIEVKNDEASTVYKWQGPANDDGTPVSVLAFAPSRDLNEFDLAAMTPDQRLGLQINSESNNAAWELVGTVPEGLIVGADRDASPAIDGMDEEGLLKLSRAQLNAAANEHGIANADGFGNKRDLAQAILATMPPAGGDNPSADDGGEEQ